MCAECMGSSRTAGRSVWALEPVVVNPPREAQTCMAGFKEEGNSHKSSQWPMAREIELWLNLRGSVDKLLEPHPSVHRTVEPHPSDQSQFTA